MPDVFYVVLLALGVVLFCGGVALIIGRQRVASNMKASGAIPDRFDSPVSYVVLLGVGLMFLGVLSLVTAGVAARRDAFGFMDGGTPAAVRSEANDLAIVVCSDIAVGHLLVESRNLSRGQDWQVLWKVDSPFSAKSGETLMPSRAPLEKTNGEFRTGTAVEPGDTVRVFIAESGPENGGAVIVRETFLVGEEGLSELDWLKSDHSTSTDPCA